MKRQPVDNYEGDITLGIDVSKYQGDIDWDELVSDAPDLKFAIIRTGDGRSTDKWFKDNWQEAKRVGLIRGSYHYFRADRGGKEQARHVVSLIKDAGGFEPGDLPPAIDIEDGTAKNLTGGVFDGGGPNLPLDTIAEECLEFLKTIQEELGVQPLVYTGQAFHWWFSQGRPDLAVKFAEFPLWLPSYTAQPLMPVDKEGNAFPWEAWDIWQYKSTGRVPGIVGNVDMNRFRGTEEDLEDFIEQLSLSKIPPKQTMHDALIAEAKVLTDQLQEVLDELSGMRCKCQD